MNLKEKMNSFLRSLHIENVEDFDLNFQSVGRNEKRHEQIDMIIVKDTPWRYSLLNQFQEGLNTVTYPYNIRFLYLKRPSPEDAYNLFFEWYQSIYRAPSDLNVSHSPSSLKFTFKSEEEKEKYYLILFDFRDFLSFINYEILIQEEVGTPKKVEEKIEEAPKIEAPVENIDLESVNEIIQKEKEDQTSVTEELYLNVLKKNLEDFKAAKERQRLNKRGNYTVVDSIDDITADSDHVDFIGKVFHVEEKEFGGKKRYTIGVFDNGGEGAIYVEQSGNASFTPDVAKKCVWGTNIRVRGVVYNSDFNKSVAVRGHYIDLLPEDDIIPDSGETRVELHLHSNMSAMDAVSDMNAYCKYAKALGHKAIGITDHAVAQGYPDAQKAGAKYGLKVLYGIEFYMIEDKLKYIFNPSDDILNKATYVVLDTETTGLSAKYNRIIQFGAVKVEHGTIVDRLNILINPLQPIPKKIVQITGINDDKVKDKPTIDKVLPQILNFIGDSILVTHNASFDIAMMNAELKRNGFNTIDNPIIDTLQLSRYLFPDSRSHRLGALCKNMEVNYNEEEAHSADYDAQVLNDVWQPMLVLLTKENKDLRHKDLDLLETSSDLYKHMKPSHVVAYAKDKVGLKDLYKLISYSHIKYLADVPKIPRSEIEKHREHLILGSACFNGEVFSTARYYEEEELLRVMDFYDYIEVQPLENYSWLVNMRENTQDEIVCLVKDIINAADKLGKLVCATGDAHYATKDQKLFRDVYIFAKGLGGTLHPLNPYSRKNEKDFPNPDQHYRSTREMLECFNFLGEEKAKEIVVTNTNKIADEIEAFEAVPVPKNPYTPTIEHCEENLRELCYTKAHQLYGENLPQLIEDRLKKELDGIIDNGYAVIYYIAHKIIKKANDDGYVVGSRGSVGSSFAATMASITEVNALPPHYLCPHCHHFELTSETMPEYKSGYDLPDKICPVCGEKMIHDGQNIPFETFLGFNANKVPDIDLNFPNDYQSKAHDYTKVLLGETKVFRAGTIETVAEKTAFGYAKGYIERKLALQGVDEREAANISANYSKAKIAFLASGCENVKRTTGQHPGGIIVVPNANDVYDFTPVQYPADDMDASWQTTHFDFHSIHDTILKLDLLGHVDPLALKKMCELTGVDMKSIPMNDPRPLSLFSSPDELKMDGNYDNVTTGSLGLPEFGTDFVRGILESTKPKSFADLVIISGISHGTNVWNGNAEDLIKNGVTDLHGIIGCRDDIMTYLISMGLPSETSFKIMEDVRKGRGLTEEQETLMRTSKVPEYYIQSCKKIKYLFPKGHAVAYVTMAMRVAYFKIYYPLEYYAVFFSVRSKQYDIEVMVKGKDAIFARVAELNAKVKSKEKLSPKETEQLKTLHLAIEMVQRGYKFENIDINKSDATDFIVDKENNALIPPFITVDQLGENAAQSVIAARKEGEFTSKENLLKRTKLSSTNVGTLAKMGVLDELDEDDQLTLF